MLSTALSTTHRFTTLAIAVLWTLPASAGDLLPPASVYVAPGGVYIGSAQVYAGPGAGNGGQPYAVPGAAYVPGYGPGYAVPDVGYAPTYAPVPAYRAPPLAVYGAGPSVGPRAYGSPYPTEYAPRPPVAVPYASGDNCVISYGRMYCD